MTISNNISGARKLFSRAAFSIAALLLSLAALEAVSASALLLIFKKDPASAQLLSHFPAQLRMDSASRRASVFDTSGIVQADRQTLISPYSFDPEMGFRGEGYIVRSGDSSPDKTICCLGGSTTAGDNWPEHLIARARAHGATGKISVINAGVPGYMSSNQRLWLTDWVLGKRKQHCDAIVSLDGVNDVHFRIAAYMTASKNGTSWTPAWHAFQQKLDGDMRRLMTPRGAALQFASNTARSGSRIWGAFAAALPYTSRATFKLSLETARRKRVADMKRQAAAVTFNSDRELVLPPNVRAEIVDSFRGTLLDLAGAANIRGIPFTSYLQPINLNKYYDDSRRAGVPNPANFVQRDIGAQLGSLFPVDVRPIYGDVELMYAQLAREHPENFANLIYLFKGKENIPLYSDTVHYTPAGSALIADEIVKDLIRRGILTRAQPAPGK